ncbi:MAG: YbaK/EbsC family protein [Candidatus Kerfeldbacteria bacterium]|nr:YbaK/EbsC family protein [Candidatus Kerfeldbacteria bacterium]
MPVPAKVKNYLSKMKIQHRLVPHKTVFTVYDLSQTLKVKLNEIVKTLLVKADQEYKLVLLPAHRRLNLEALKRLLGAKKVSLASEGEMTKMMKVKPGALTPFGQLYKLGVVVDQGLVKAEQMIFGAGSFTESIKMKVKDFLRHEQPTVGRVSEAPKK